MCALRHFGGGMPAIWSQISASLRRRQRCPDPDHCCLQQSGPQNALGSPAGWTSWPIDGKAPLQQIERMGPSSKEQAQMQPERTGGGKTAELREATPVRRRRKEHSTTHHHKQGHNATKDPQSPCHGRPPLEARLLFSLQQFLEEALARQLPREKRDCNLAS